jgi:hypothetical protein
MGLLGGFPRGSEELSGGAGQVVGIRMVTNYVLDREGNITA